MSHYVVHPEDTLTGLLGKVREGVDKRLHYEKSSLSESIAGF